MRRIARTLTAVALLLGSAVLSNKTAAEVDPHVWLRASRADFYGFGTGLASGLFVTGAPRLLRTEAGLHDESQIERVESMFLPGMELKVRILGSKRESPLYEHLLITRKGFLLAQSLRISISTRRDAEEFLGSPDRKSPSRYEYQGLNEMCRDKFALHFERNVLTAAEWEWCYD
jgi:hypothetical protein